MKRTRIVGGSTWMRGSASGACGSQTVSPISIESTPAITAISPAPADSRSDPPQPARAEELGHAEGLELAVRADAGDRRAAHEPAAGHAPDHQPSDVVVPAERHGLELERRLEVHVRGRRTLENRLEQRPQVAARVLERAHGGAFLRRGEDHRELELAIVGAEVDEQIEDLVDHLVRALLRPVDLVHHQHDAQAVRERLAHHEAGLRHHAVDRVDQQQRRVDHPEHALDLAAEVGMARCIDEMDPHALELDRGVLGVDRDAALALEVLAVHHALDHGLVLAEGAGLTQQAVDQRGLAVIDVRDDRDVADVLARLLHGARQASRPGRLRPAQSSRGASGKRAKRARSEPQASELERRESAASGPLTGRNSAR